MNELKDDGTEIEVSFPEYQQYSHALESINTSLVSGKKDWINRAVCNLLDLTKTDNIGLKFLIFRSDAFVTLCARFSESKLSYILRIILNLSARCPRLIHHLINSNIIFTALENLSSCDDNIIITSLKIINNLIISSYFSRLCLVSSNFFQYADKFLKDRKLLEHHQRMSIYIQNLINCFFNPSIPIETATPEELNNPYLIIQTLTQTSQALSANPSNANIDLEFASNIIANDNRLIIGDHKDPMWLTISLLLQKNDSIMIKSALVSIRAMIHQSQANSLFVLNNTSLFDQTKNFCSRRNDSITTNLFSILSSFYMYDENTSNRLFLRNGLFEFVFNFVTHENESVRLSALRLLSNAISIRENGPIISQLFNEQFVNHLITVLQTDYETSFHEKEETLFILFNAALSNPSILQPLFDSLSHLELMIDYLTMVSSNTCVVELRALDILIDNCSDDSFLQYFVQGNGYNAIENMMSSQITYISEAAENFYNKHLAKFAT